MNDAIQFKKMTTAPIGRLITSLAIPTIMSMMITSIYNMADTFFVGKLGRSATGAVGIVFSLMAIIQAVGFTLGMGSGSNISRLLGQKENEKANRIASTGFFSAIILGLILAIFGLSNVSLLMKLLGSTDTILPYAIDYAKYILYGAPVMCSSFVLNNIIRSQGKAVLSMVGIGLGGILNIILDPIFIFYFDMGISGAAIATLISQIISFLILISFFVFNKTTVKINFKYFSHSLIGLIIKTGIPSFSRQGLASIAGVALNLAAKPYGDAAVAALSIVTKIFMFILSVLIGFGQGYQPVIGYNYGAQKYNRVREAFYFSLKACTLIMLALAIIGYIYAPQIIQAFQKNDIDVVTIGVFTFRAQCIILPLHPLIVLSNMTFQVIGKAFEATFLSSCRQGIFFLPLIFIMPLLMGLTGVQLTQTFADILSSICAGIFIFPFIKSLNNKENTL